MPEVPCWKSNLRNLYVSKNNDPKDYMLACECIVMGLRHSMILIAKRPKEGDIQFQHALVPSAPLAPLRQKQQNGWLTGGPPTPDAEGVRQGGTVWSFTGARERRVCSRLLPLSSRVSLLLSFSIDLLMCLCLCARIFPFKCLSHIG